MEKRGFFFSLDSFLAIILFTVVLVMIYIFFIQFSPLQQQYYFSEDLLTVFSNVEIQDLDINIDNPELSKYPRISDLVANKKINDTTVTLLEQIATFYIEDDIDSATVMVDDLSTDLFKEQYGVALDIGGEEVYSQQTEDVVSLLARQRLIIGKRKL